MWLIWGGITMLALPPMLLIAGIYFTLNGSPLQPVFADRNVSIFQQHLARGESRRELEAFFGHGIPAPDVIGTVRLPRLTRTLPRLERTPRATIQEYNYLRQWGLCQRYYDTVEVHYDSADRVRSWRSIRAMAPCES